MQLLEAGPKPGCALLSQGPQGRCHWSPVQSLRCQHSHGTDYDITFVLWCNLIKGTVFIGHTRARGETVQPAGRGTGLLGPSSSLSPSLRKSNGSAECVARWLGVSRCGKLRLRAAPRGEGRGLGHRVGFAERGRWRAAAGSSAGAPAGAECAPAARELRLERWGSDGVGCGGRTARALTPRSRERL